MCSNLNDLVRQFKAAVEQGHQGDSWSLLEQIREACNPVVSRVRSKYSNLGSFVEEIRDEKLHDCLMMVDPDLITSFRAYYGRALVLCANDQYRRLKRQAVTHSNHQDKVPTPADPLMTIEAEEQIALYAHRKRQLVDEAGRLLNIEARYATLLIDQRHRMAAICQEIGWTSCKLGLSAWVEAKEQWHQDDDRKSISNNGPQCGAVWGHLAHAVDSETGELTYDHVISAIRQAGGVIDTPAWRKRVSRYVAVLRDAFDDEEIRYFVH